MLSERNRRTRDLRQRHVFNVGTILDRCRDWSTFEYTGNMRRPRLLRFEGRHAEEDARRGIFPPAFGPEILSEVKTVDRILITGGNGFIGSHLAERLEESGHSVTLDRKSTRLNSSHLVISYAVFCLKKKNIKCTLIVGAYQQNL